MMVMVPVAMMMTTIDRNEKGCRSRCNAAIGRGGAAAAAPTDGRHHAVAARHADYCWIIAVATTAPGGATVRSALCGCRIVYGGGRRRAILARAAYRATYIR